MLILIQYQGYNPGTLFYSPYQFKALRAGDLTLSRGDSFATGKKVFLDIRETGHLDVPEF